MIKIEQQNNFDVVRFCLYIKNKSEEIKKKSFSSEQTSKIFKVFNNFAEVAFLNNSHISPKDINLIYETIFDFHLALQIANSNYNEKNPGWISKLLDFSGRKLEKMDFKDIINLLKKPIIP